MRCLAAIFGLLECLAVSAQVMLPHRHGEGGNLPCTCDVQSAPSNTLLARWAFDEGSGYIVDDISGNSNSLLLMNDAAWTNSGSGSAISFNGTTAYMRTAGPLNLGTNLITVTGWFYWNQISSSNEVMFAVGDDPYRYGPNNFELVSAKSTDTIAVNILNGDGTLDGRRENFLSWSTNTWIGIACVYDNTTTNGDTKVFYCSEEQNVFTLNNTKTNLGNFAATNLFYVGNYGTTNFNGGWRFPYSGAMEDIRIYGGELTQEEICYVLNHPGESGTASPVSSLITNLVAFWPLEEYSGQRYDHWGTNNLTAYPSVPLALGRVNNCFLQSGTNYLSTPDSPELSSGSTNFTVAAWVRMTDVTSFPSGILGKRDNSFWEYQIRYSVATSRFLFDINGASVRTATANNFGAASANVWYFVVAWMDTGDDTINIQVNDGTPDSTALAGDRPSDTSAPFNLGTNGLVPGNYVRGNIDEPMFWKRVLTAGERTYLYNAGRGRSLP